MGTTTTGAAPDPDEREQGNTPATGATGTSRADAGTHRPATPHALPWTAWEPGTRVVVRYRLADGLHDALGDLLEVARDHVTIRTRRGDVRVEAATMVTGKKVPPPVW